MEANTDANGNGATETSFVHPNGSVGMTFTDAKTGRQTHYDSAPIFPRRGLPAPKSPWTDWAIALLIGLFFAVVIVIAAYCH